MGCRSSKRREGPPPVVDLYAAQPCSGRAAPAGENPAAEDQLRNCNAWSRGLHAAVQLVRGKELVPAPSMSACLPTTARQPPGHLRAPGAPLLPPVSGTMSKELEAGVTAKVWTGVGHPGFVYPELRTAVGEGGLPGLLAKEDFAVCISGGGHRAAVNALGYVRDLHQKEVQVLKHARCKNLCDLGHRSSSRIPDLPTPSSGPTWHCCPGICKTCSAHNRPSTPERPVWLTRSSSLRSPSLPRRPLQQQRRQLVQHCILVPARDRDKRGTDRSVPGQVRPPRKPFS